MTETPKGVLDKPLNERNEMTSLKNFYLGQLVVNTDNIDAQVYTVGALQGLNVYAVWFEGNQKCGGWADRGGFFSPTLKQIERCIYGGRLASGKDITDCLTELAA
jgi:hypothetical protein